MGDVTFSVADYAIFAVALAISAGIGVFYAFRSRGKRVDDIHTGGRKLPLIPTAVSLLCSFVSGIAILSYPEEIYRKGIVFAWTLLGAWLAIAVSGLVILPVLYPLKYTNLYQYFEDRFGSKILRFYGDFLFIAATIVYSGVVLYTPSKALVGVTALPLWALLLILGLVCTVYTAIGGIKAVIWTDTFQGVVMYAGIIALLVKGVLAVGSDRISDLAREGGRLDGLSNIDPNPLQYMTIWTGVFGGMFYWLGAFGASQIALQRFCSLKSLDSARVVALLNVPGIGVVFALVFAVGLVMYAYYRVHCHPPVGKDELTMAFMLAVLKDTYGFPGLFMAGVMSGTLSTVSSAINSMAAVTWCDFVVPRLQGASSFTEKIVAQVVALFFGGAIVAMAFVVEPMGGSIRVLFYCLGALSGPMVGLTLLGIVIPWADYLGAFSGVICGSAVNLLIFVSKVLHKPYNADDLPSPTTCCGQNFTETCPRVTLHEPVESVIPEISSISLVHLASISGIMITCIGAVTTIFVGSLVSLISRKSLAKTRPELVLHPFRPARVAPKVQHISTMTPTLGEKPHFSVTRV